MRDTRDPETLGLQILNTMRYRRLTVVEAADAVERDPDCQNSSPGTNGSGPAPGLPRQNGPQRPARPPDDPSYFSR